ncbi:hypothetical protein AAMO2058_001444500 [Amorphochlora amoebiformis]
MAAEHLLLLPLISALALAASPSLSMPRVVPRSSLFRSSGSRNAFSGPHLRRRQNGFVEGLGGAGLDLERIKGAEPLMRRDVHVSSMIDPFETDEDEDEWTDADGEDGESPLYVDRDGKKMTEEEYYFKVLGKPMPKSSDEGTATAEASKAESTTPSKKERRRRNSPALRIPEGGLRPRRGPRNMSRIERILDGSESKVLKRLSIARFSCKQFEKKKIPLDTLNKVLAITLRAPTAFNVHPYKVVMVTDDLLKVRLTGGMMGNNKEKVLQAGATAVFLADLDPIQNTPKLERLYPPKEPEWRLYETPPTPPREIPRYVRFFGEELNTPREWAMKNTMIAASFYLLAATSMGLATAPIEGFNEKIVLDTLNLDSERYHIPIMIPTGYPDYTGSFTKRLDPSEVFFLNTLDEPITNIRALTDSSLAD